MSAWQNYWKNLNQNLTQSLGKLSRIFKSGPDLDWKELEDALLAADLGSELTASLISELKDRSDLKDLPSTISALSELLSARLAPFEGDATFLSSKNFKVILFVGVNGAGKTTTLSKIAYYFKTKGLKPLIAAGDTFRAAAIEQLTTLAKKQDIAVVAQQSGADSAAVIFDAIKAAKARGFDLVLADTAGRLPTQHDFLQELNKIQRVIYKFDPNMHLEVFLVLDATIGQHALMQAEEFNKAIKLTGLCLTKLDSPAKGGVVFKLASKFQLPIYFVGVGEGVEDLAPFSATDLAANLVKALSR